MRGKLAEGKHLEPVALLHSAQDNYSFMCGQYTKHHPNGNLGRRNHRHAEYIMEWLQYACLSPSEESEEKISLLA